MSMSPTPSHNASVVEWGASTFTLAGETESGDLQVVKLTDRGALVAVIDGAGHGSQAASAARSAAQALEQHAEENLISLMNRCHRQLQGTRGAVITLASFDDSANELTWLGVGNVTGVLLRPSGNGREDVLQRGGTVGHWLPPLRVATLTVSARDTLILATDGIRADLAKGMRWDETPQATADRLCAEYVKGNDDGLVLVVRYVGRNG